MKQVLLSQKEVAKIIGVSENTIKNWRESKHLSYFKAPGSRRIMYFEEDVNAFIENNTRNRKRGDALRNKVLNKGKSKISSNLNEDWRID